MALAASKSSPASTTVAPRRAHALDLERVRGFRRIDRDRARPRPAGVRHGLPKVSRRGAHDLRACRQDSAPANPHRALERADRWCQHFGLQDHPHTQVVRQRLADPLRRVEEDGVYGCRRSLDAGEGDATFSQRIRHSLPFHLVDVADPDAPTATAAPRARSARPGRGEKSVRQRLRWCWLRGGAGSAHGRSVFPECRWCG